MKIQFTNPRLPRSVKELSPIERVQLEAAGHLYDGNDLSADERLNPERSHGEGEDEGSFLGFLEIWDVEKGGEVIYDALMYMVDSGSVFLRGTTEEVAQCIQTYFEAEEDDLADVLQEAYREAKLKFATKLKAARGDGPWQAYAEAMDDDS